MLVIKVKGRELYSSSKNEFFKVKDATLKLEHSLISISKWESKWHKPFLNDDEKTGEELVDYIRCMTLNSEVDPNIYFALSKENIKQINDYIADKHTATWFNDNKNALPKVNPNKKTRHIRGEIITAEIIYYWMVAYQIPFECEKWHINKLLTLIKVCNIKNEPEKKMSKAEIMRRNSAINAARRKQYNSKG